MHNLEQTRTPSLFFLLSLSLYASMKPRGQVMTSCVYCVHTLIEFPLLQAFYKSLIPPNFLCLFPIECNPGLERVQMLPLLSLNLSG